MKWKCCKWKIILLQLLVTVWSLDACFAILRVYVTLIIVNGFLRDTEKANNKFYEMITDWTTQLTTVVILINIKRIKLLTLDCGLIPFFVQEEIWIQAVADTVHFYSRHLTWSKSDRPEKNVWQSRIVEIIFRLLWVALAANLHISGARNSEYKHQR